MGLHVEHFPLNLFFPDLDREEVFTGGLPEFPSLDNGTSTNGDEDDDHSLGLFPAPPQPEAPIEFRNTPAPHKDQPDRALELVTQIAGGVIAAGVTAAIQEKIDAAVGLVTASQAELSKLPGSSRLLELAEESDSDVEDFELLDQSELERLEGELGLGGGAAQAKEAHSSGFLSKLLRRH